jgi:predicted secreted Zn-dependent protease
MWLLISPKFILLALILILSACGGGGNSSSGSGSSTVSSSGGTGLSSSHPNVTVRISKQFYEVFGNGISTLEEELKRKGPGSFFGRVASTISYDYKTRGNCEISSVGVTLVSIVTLPQWTPTAGAASATIAKWKSFIKALEAHELNHLIIDIGESETLARELLGISRQSNCVSIDQLVKSAHLNAVERAAVRNRNYDARTNHGKTEGAVL